MQIVGLRQKTVNEILILDTIEQNVYNTISLLLFSATQHLAQLLLFLSFFTINYIKKETNDKDDQVLRLIATYFSVGIKEAKYYIDKILTKDQIKEIVDIYKYGENKTIKF